MAQMRELNVPSDCSKMGFSVQDPTSLATSQPFQLMTSLSLHVPTARTASSVETFAAMSRSHLVISPYPGYNPQVNAGTANSFATAAYRYDHSLIRPQFDRLDANYRPLAIGPVNLVNPFFNPTQFHTSLGSDPILHGLVSVNSRRVDEFLNIVLTTQLFQANISPGMDLASQNIQRGRDHGLPPTLLGRTFASIYYPTLRMNSLLSASSKIMVLLRLWISGLVALWRTSYPTPYWEQHLLAFLASPSPTSGQETGSSMKILVSLVLHS